MFLSESLFGSIVLAFEHATVKRLASFAALQQQLVVLGDHELFHRREVRRATRYDAPLSLMMIDADDFKAFNGLHQRSPFLAFAITVAAASLAGVPLTAGFTGKFLAFSAAAGAHQWALLAIAAAAASAGFYYYFKVLRHVFWNRPAEGAAPITVPPLTRLLVVALITCTFAAGIFFQPFVNLLR